MCYDLDKKCDNNIQRRLIFENTIVHNTHKGCWWGYSNLCFQVAQQTINCSTCIKTSKFLFFLFFQRHFESFFNVKEKNSTVPNVHL
jgi:hypothetical protein